METLEGRRLLATIGVPPEVAAQNAAIPEDANNDGQIAPIDVLLVINELNNPPSGGATNTFSTDVNGDGVVSPLDALLIVNRLNSGSEKSSVPPEQRAIGLRKSLDAGLIPPRMSLSEAQELLETLEQGGHYEVGERFRDGEMININRDPQELVGTTSGGKSADAASAAQTVDPTSEELLPETEELQSVEENDPLALFDSAEETLTDPLYDSTLWQAFLGATDGSDSEGGDGFSIGLADQLAKRLALEDAHEHMAQVIAEAFQSGDKTVEDIISEVAALRATLGDANSQIAQLFSNLDVKGIIEQSGVDLGMLAEALVAASQPDSSYDEAERPDFMSRESLEASVEILR